MFIFFYRLPGFVNLSRIIKRIHELVAEGVKEVGEMKRHLKIFVKEVLFRDEQLPQDTNRRYFPRTSDLRSHMYRATVKNRMSRIDQANVQMKIGEWTKVCEEDSFYFRPHSDQDTEKQVPNDDCCENESGSNVKRAEGDHCILYITFI